MVRPSRRVSPTCRCGGAGVAFGRGIARAVSGCALAGAAVAALVSVLVVSPAPAQEPAGAPYDYLLKGGIVIDGTGTPRFPADVAIRDDRIVRVSREPLDSAQGRVLVDAEGLVVAPGFIDFHAHVEELDRYPLAESKLRQGIATVVYAPDGNMPWPLAEYIAELKAGGHAPNIAFFAGHNTIRREVMGTANRAPTAAELQRMQRMVAQAMAEGAIGLSTGLRYVPGAYSETDEVIALATVAAQHGGIYASHIRNEGPGTLEAVRELTRIAREAQIPAQLTHHKLMGGPQHGMSVQTLALVDSARAEGLDITIDQYPYMATSTSTAVLFPSWALAGGTDSLRARLADPDVRARIEAGIREKILTERGGGDLSRIQLSRVSFNPTWEGKTFADIAHERGQEPTVDFGIELAIEIQSQGGAGGVWHVVDEQDMRRIMQYPWTMIASDGGIGVLGREHPHPRYYGAFPRVLARYVREEGVLTLEQAIEKMTSLPAWRIGLPERGRIAEGLVADVVVFDAEAIRDRATFVEPHQFSVGVEHLFVNGTPVLRAGALTGERPGQVLRRQRTEATG